MSFLAVPDPDLRALATGEVVVAFAPRGAVEAGDEVELQGAGPRPAGQLKAAYRHWSTLGPPAGEWTAVVDSIHPAAVLDRQAGDARHHLSGVPDGDVVVLRVFGEAGPALSDAAFAARLRSLEQAL